MFDISEYYETRPVQPGLYQGIDDIETEISYTIDSILSNRYTGLYTSDRFKTTDGSLNIYYPVKKYPLRNSVLMTPDRLRFLLSVYPYREPLSSVNSIIIIPRYIETSSIELMAMYIPEKKALALYLHHNYSLKVNTADDVQLSTNIKPESSSLFFKSGAPDFAPLLWRILASIDSSPSGHSQKFFLKKSHFPDTEYSILNDISFYYSSYGY